MSKSSRRGFVKGSLGTGFLLIAGTKSSGNFFGANDRVRIAIAGLNGRGGSHLDEFSQIEGCEIASLVDPDTRVFRKRQKKLAEINARPRLVQDIRKVLDDKTVDAVTIATPNHWHALMTIWACQAGKDVYVEKPCSHNIHEGRMAVETARKHGRIVQHGTQSRSSGGWERAAAAIASGKLGKLLVSRGLCYKRRKSIDFKDPTAPPPEVDFNLWLGPAPQQPFHANLVHYNWHWFWDSGNGDIGNQGVHEMDKARWMIPGATLPKRVISMGGRFGYKDQGQTPNTQIAIFDYGDTQLVFEVRGLETPEYHNQGVGNVMHLESGVIEGTKYIPRGSKEAAPLPDVQARRPGAGNIFENFINAVRSRKREEQFADILEGHYSSALCHLANASYRVGEQVPFNAKSKSFGDNKVAYEALERMADHLKANSVPIDGMTYQVGKVLTIDPTTELTDDPRANEILRGTYRAPFTVPQRVA